MSTGGDIKFRYHVRRLNHPTAKFSQYAAAIGLRGMGGLRVRSVVAAVLPQLFEERSEGCSFR